MRYYKAPIFNNYGEIKPYFEIIRCPVCSIVFADKKANHRVYCSNECNHKSQEKLSHAFCNNCGKEFAYSPISSHGMFCSDKCHGLSKRKREEVECLVCHKKFISKISDKRKFCSGECYKKYHVGKKHHWWKGGIFIKKYIKVYAPNHSRAVGSYVFEHLLVMEEKIGRPVKLGEIVHHVNGDPLDNRPKNLMLLPNQKSHAYYHRMGRFLENN